MSLFNSNFIRTILGAISGATVLNVALKLTGCTGDNIATPTVVEPFVCSGSAWIPIEYQAIAAITLMILSGIIKAFWKTGTVAQNLTAPSVPVVAPQDSKAGVVTHAQVAANK